MGTMLIYIGLATAGVGFIITLMASNNLPLLGGGVIPQDDSYAVFLPIVVAFMVSILMTVVLRLFK